MQRFAGVVYFVLRLNKMLCGCWCVLNTTAIFPKLEENKSDITLLTVSQYNTTTNCCHKLCYSHCCNSLLHSLKTCFIEEKEKPSRDEVV